MHRSTSTLASTLGKKHSGVDNKATLITAKTMEGNKAFHDREPAHPISDSVDSSRAQSSTGNLVSSHRDVRQILGKRRTCHTGDAEELTEAPQKKTHTPERAYCDRSTAPLEGEETATDSHQDPGPIPEEVFALIRKIKQLRTNSRGLPYRTELQKNLKHHFDARYRILKPSSPLWTHYGDTTLLSEREWLHLKGKEV